MIIRIISNILLVSVALFLPTWCFFGFSLFFLIYFRYGFEVLLYALALDSAFAIPASGAFINLYLYTTITTLSLVMVEVSRTRFR